MSSEKVGKEIYESVEQAVDDWVESDGISARREGDEFVADEEALVENITIMVAVALDEASV